MKRSIVWRALDLVHLDWTSVLIIQLPNTFRGTLLKQRATAALYGSPYGLPITYSQWFTNSVLAEMSSALSLCRSRICRPFSCASAVHGLLKIFSIKMDVLFAT